jgi:hypothetical protein
MRPADLSTWPMSAALLPQGEGTSARNALVAEPRP